MKKSARIYVAGHRGLVGSAIVRRLRAEGYDHLLLRTAQELDMTSEAEVDAFFVAERPDYVFLPAGEAGGILADRSRPADFLAENVRIELNVIEAAHGRGVEKLLFLGSSSVYPEDAPRPTREEHLLSGPLEPTYQPYALARIVGIELCQSHHRQHGDRFITAMPTDLYGPRDAFDLESGHVLPALIRKFHDAKRDDADEVVVWGTGQPLRDFLHVDDLADACLFLMQEYEEPDIINVGAGHELSIGELARLVRDVVGYDGQIVYDTEKPDGMPRKALDTSRINALGWSPSIGLREGIASTYKWYRKHHDDG